jgi:hypothetical protein
MNILDIKMAFIKFQKFPILSLILLIPFTHRELFNVVTPEIVFVKFPLVLLSITGLFTLLINRKYYLKNPLIIVFGIFLLLTSISVFWSKDLASSFKMIGFLFAIFLSIPAVINYLKTDKHALRDIKYAYLLSFIIVTVFLLVQAIMIHGFNLNIGGIWRISDYPPRFGSTFWDINHYGIYLVSIFYLLLSKVIESKKGRTVFIILAILALISLRFTYSRSSYIAFFVSIVFFAGIYYSSLKNSFKVRLPFLLKSVLITGSPFLLVSLVIHYADLLKSMFLFRAVSFYAHLILLKFGLYIGATNFLTGIGTNSFYEHFRNSDYYSIYHFVDPTTYKIPLHNLWLEVFTETGILNLIVFIIFWTFLVVGLVRLFILKKDVLALVLASGIVAFLTGGLMYSYKAEFFWFFVILAISYLSFKGSSIFLDSKLRENIISLIKFIKGRIILTDLIIVVLSFFLILLPFLFVFKPLTTGEYSFIANAGFSENLLSSYIREVTLYFRYIFGNYNFAVRTPQIILYFSTLLLVYVWNKKCNKFKDALFLTSIFAGFISILVNGFEIGTNWLLTLITAFMVFAVVSIIEYIYKKGASTLYQSGSFNFKKSIALLIVFLWMGFLRFHFSGSNDSDKNLSTVMETAYNQKLFERSNIILEEGIPVEMVNFYCDLPVRSEDNKIILEPCDYNYSNSKNIFYPDLLRGSREDKTVVIGSQKFVETYLAWGYAFFNLEDNIVLYKNLMIWKIKEAVLKEEVQSNCGL